MKMAFFFNFDQPENTLVELSFSCENYLKKNIKTVFTNAKQFYLTPILTAQILVTFLGKQVDGFYSYGDKDIDFKNGVININQELELNNSLKLIEIYSQGCSVEYVVLNFTTENSIKI